MKVSELRKNWEANNDTPPPGSDKARDKGCSCPVLDNGHGEGGHMGGYTISGDCSIHSAPST